MGNADGSINWVFANSDPGWTNSAENETGIIPPLNEWTHLAIVYDSAAHLVETYINGESRHRFNSSGVGAISDVNSVQNDLRIGHREACSPGAGLCPEVFNGQIDEVRIWSVARTQQEIKSNYDRALTGGESGLEGYWRFNEAFGTDTRDESTHGNDGTLVGTEGGSPSWSKSASTISFTATSDEPTVVVQVEGSLLIIRTAPIEFDDSVFDEADWH